MFRRSEFYLGAFLCWISLSYQQAVKYNQLLGQGAVRSASFGKNPPIGKPLSHPFPSVRSPDQLTSHFQAPPQQHNQQYHQQYTAQHPDANSKYYNIMVNLERPTATTDNTLEVLSSIFTIFQSMPMNNLLAEDAFKIVGRPCVILIVKGRPGGNDIASSIERVVRSLERLGTKVEVTLLYSVEAFVEYTASKLIPLSALVGTTRAPIGDIGYKNLYKCRLTYSGNDMNKLTYVSQTLNITLDMMERRAAGNFIFKGHRIAGTQPFEFQFYIHQEPQGNEMGALMAIPLMHAGNVQMQTEEVQPLGHVLDTMSNTQTVNIAKV
ncbi:hypothetical protein SNE40_020045 [Patella caerulea]|uniref:Uncharacterized protein n=1 Tax=Patella caerulea TaxID=87958 RepID=A0AAN8G341_PATCE